MSFFKNRNTGKITENDLPETVKKQLEQIGALKDKVDNIDPSVVGGDIDLGSFDK